MQKHEKYEYTLRTDATVSKLNGPLFIHNDLAKLECNKTYFYDVTLALFALMEMTQNNVITVTFSSIVSMSKAGATVFNKPYKIVKFMNEYRDYITGPTRIIDDTKERKLTLFDDVNINRDAREVTFTATKDAMYLITEPNEKKNFFTIRGEYLNQIRIYSHRRLFLYLYSYIRWGRKIISRHTLTKLCGLNSETRDSKLKDNLINPTLGYMRDKIGTGSVANVCPNIAVEAYDFHWHKQTRTLGNSKREELKTLDTNPPMIEGKTYPLLNDDEINIHVWNSVYEVADAFIQQGIFVDDSYLNMSSILGIISELEVKWGCTFTNKLAAAKYYDENR